MIFRSPPYFYFRFRRYGPLDGRFCLIFALTAQQSVLDGTNGLSNSNPCAYCRIVRSELKPEVVLATIIDPERCKWPQSAYKWAGIALLTSPTGAIANCGGTIFLRRSVHLNGLWNLGYSFVLRSVKAYVRNVVNYLTTVDHATMYLTVI